MFNLHKRKSRITTPTFPHLHALVIVRFWYAAPKRKSWALAPLAIATWHRGHQKPRTPWPFRPLFPGPSQWTDFVHQILSKKKLGSMEWFGLRENLQEPPLNPLMGICLRLSEIVCSIYGCDMLWWQGTARPELLWTSSFWEWWTIAAETNLQLLFCTDHLRQ